MCLNTFRFRGPSNFSDVIFTNDGEGDIAKTLTEIADAYPSVDIGSYPNTSKDSRTYTTKFVLHSRQEDAIAQASKAILDRIPSCWK